MCPPLLEIQAETYSHLLWKVGVDLPENFKWEGKQWFMAIKAKQSKINQQKTRMQWPRGPNSLVCWLPCFPKCRAFTMTSQSIPSVHLLHLHYVYCCWREISKLTPARSVNAHGPFGHWGPRLRHFLFDNLNLSIHGDKTLFFLYLAKFEYPSRLQKLFNELYTYILKYLRDFCLQLLALEGKNGQLWGSIRTTGNIKRLFTRYEIIRSLISLKEFSWSGKVIVSHFLSLPDIPV